MMQDMRRRRRNPVVGCLLPILGLIAFMALCYGFCLVIFLIGNGGTDTGTGSSGIILLPYLMG